MGDNSGIEWTDATWNPVVGCSVVSPGCTNCYAMKMAARLEAMAPKPDGRGNHGLIHYEGTTQHSRAGAVWTGKVALAPDPILLAPLRWRRPRRIFVNSMGDLFHESVPDEWIDKVFAVMALAPQHTFQVLTKRARRMRAYMTSNERTGDFEPMMRIIEAARKIRPDNLYNMTDWPLPNVWLGVSVEDQTRANERIPDLLATPTAVRFVSAEPLLGPINLRRIRIAPNHHTIIDALDGYAMVDTPGRERERTMLDWVIAGGESGPHARPMHSAWVRSLRDQCATAGVPFFFKQWGEWLPIAFVGDGPRLQLKDHHTFPDGTMVRRVGKRVAGRLLDDRTHDAFPTAHSPLPIAEPA